VYVEALKIVARERENKSNNKRNAEIEHPDIEFEI
jgi:uncharacterized protein YoaH (UPF0181 family)